MIRLALPLMLTTLPAFAETTEAQLDCIFDQRCTQEACAAITPKQAFLAVHASGKAQLTWEDTPAPPPLDLTYDLTPAGTVMANGPDGADLVLMSASPPRGPIAMTRLSPDGTQVNWWGGLANDPRRRPSVSGRQPPRRRPARRDGAGGV